MNKKLKDINQISDLMYYEMIDKNMSDPEPLDIADLTKPFIYDRDWGVFYIRPGLHQMAMCVLYAWRHGYPSIQRMLQEEPDFEKIAKINNRRSDSEYYYIAELYILELKGTAMGSSTSDYIQIGWLDNLNTEEKQIFSNQNTQILSDILKLKK